MCLLLHSGEKTEDTNQVAILAMLTGRKNTKPNDDHQEKVPISQDDKDANKQCNFSFPKDCVLPNRSHKIPGATARLLEAPVNIPYCQRCG